MQGTFQAMMSQPERNDIGGTPIVIQQYARYPGAMEPGLQSASSIGSAHSQLANSKSPPLHRKATPRSVQSSPTMAQSAAPVGQAARSGPSMSPPMFDPGRQRQTRDSVDRADARALPSRDITDENIDDAYILFIFYCNPNVLPSADSSELRKTFRCPPRSDGKSFSIFTLWELIKKLDSKELKTWIQLAIELGVEPPDMEKKQSTQKVQQYAVRLKRWMRAMHVDAFFEYCLGHPHPYYTQLPANNAVVSDSRDGVPLEEDLALRALAPHLKPKRGRKRAEEKDIPGERALKRPQLDTSVGVFQTSSFPAHSATFPQSAIPFSAFPEDMEPSDPWMAATSSFPTEGTSDAPGTQPAQDLRWKGLDREASPANYPQSAVIPRTHHSSDMFLVSAEPQSAVTPSSGDKSRARRRHGPAVSSAWPNNTTSSTGKMRGRPPNRGTVSGPFSSFPVNPSRSDPSHLHSTGPIPSSNPPLGQEFVNAHYQQNPSFNANGKPNKLQLQVPQHSGAPVRLATPPTLLVNGVSNESAVIHNGVSGLQAEGASGMAISNASANSNRSGAPNSVISFEDVTQALSNELTRARLAGRQTALAPGEARALASIVVNSLVTMHSASAPPAAYLTSALHLGLGPQFGYSGVTGTNSSVHIKQQARNSNNPGFVGLNGGVATPFYNIYLEYRSSSGVPTKLSFEDLHFGNMSGNSMRLSSVDKGSHHDAPGNNGSDFDKLTDAEFEMDDESSLPETTWKDRYLKLRAQLQKKERSLSQYKRKILESVMADI